MRPGSPSPAKAAALKGGLPAGYILRYQPTLDTLPTMVDRAAGTHSAPMTGGATFDGTLGAVFDGLTGSAQGAYQTDLNVANWSVAFRLNSTTALASKYILSRWRTTDNQRCWALITRLNGALWVPRLIVSANGTSIALDSYANLAAADGSDHLWVVTYSPTALAAWRDGVAVTWTAQPASVTPYTSTSPFGVAYSGEGTTYVTGSYHGVIFWPRTLTPTEAAGIPAALV